MSLAHSMLDTFIQTNFVSGLSSDGTSNQTLRNFLTRLRFGAITIIGIILVVRTVAYFAAGSKSTNGKPSEDTKGMTGLVTLFLVCVGVIVGVWWLIDVAIRITTGVIGG